jgi:hypothetical protein
VRDWMHAELMAEIPPGERYAEAARGWLDGVMNVVFPDLLESLRVNPSTKTVNAVNADQPWGEPGQMRGEIWVSVKTPVPRRGVPVTDRSWQRMLGSLAQSPLTVLVSVRPLGEDGFPVREPADIEVRRFPFEPGWVRFSFSARGIFTWQARLAEVPDPGAKTVLVAQFREGSEFPVAVAVDAAEIEKVRPGPGGGWPGSPGLQDQWAGFVGRQAALIGASAGWMTDDPPEGSDTVVQQPNWPPGTALLGADQKVLNRFFWISVLPPALAGRLGGAGTLSRSGAFYEATDLPDGSLWLRATPTLNEFTGDRVAAVRHALAPVLPGGQPHE